MRRTEKDIIGTKEFTGETLYGTNYGQSLGEFCTGTEKDE